MVAVTLELPCPKDVEGIAVDPQPDWTFDALLVELSSIERKLNSSKNFTKIKSRESPEVKDNRRPSKSFVMHVSDDELEDIDSCTKENVLVDSVVRGRRFVCNELYLSESDDSEDELPFGVQSDLMDRGGMVEGALSELEREHQLSTAEKMRNQIFVLESDLSTENENFATTLARLDKHTEVQRETDMKLDLQYHRRIAEALDNHLTAVQREHEHRSQIEEKRIRDDAAREEAKRKEKALSEEKARQEKIKAEAEMQAKLVEAKRAEEAKAAALEAERRAKEAALNKNVPETLTRETSKEVESLTVSGSDVPKTVKSAGDTIKGAASALQLEERRLEMHKQVSAENEALGSGSNKAFRKHESEIVRRIRTITGSKENVRVRAVELIELINDSSCPPSISIAIFANKVISFCTNPIGSFNGAIYAYAHVVVLVTSKVPLAMDFLVAELNRVCIYTVPKFVRYSQSAFRTREVYFRTIGFQEEDGRIESIDSYLQRLSSCMKLYGALVQTEVEGVQNSHGIEQGWAWLARFLNALPANLYTATALEAFLEMAGFALYRRYRAQFMKLVNIISRDFLTALKGAEDTKLTVVIANIRAYIESKKFLQEPEGWRLKDSLDSKKFSLESDYEEQYNYGSNRSFHYSR